MVVDDLHGTAVGQWVWMGWRITLLRGALLEMGVELVGRQLEGSEDGGRDCGLRRSAPHTGSRPQLLGVRCWYCADMDHDEGAQGGDDEGGAEQYNPDEDDSIHTFLGHTGTARTPGGGGLCAGWGDRHGVASSDAVPRACGIGPRSAVVGMPPRRVCGGGG